MKLQFISKSKAVAEKFSKHIKTDRQLDSETVEKDGQFTVEYSIADYCDNKTTMAGGVSCEPCGPSWDDLSNLAQYIFREMQYQTNWLSAELSYLEHAFYSHQKGHLPPISGAEKMQKALTVLGIGEDYEVQKPVVWVQASLGGGRSLEVDFSAKK